MITGKQTINKMKQIKSQKNKLTKKEKKIETKTVSYSADDAPIDPMTEAEFPLWIATDSRCSNYWRAKRAPHLSCKLRFAIYI